MSTKFPRLAVGRSSPASNAYGRSQLQTGSPEPKKGLTRYLYR
ncbi:hypothetical protein QUA82_18620 [Microcoleus sp. F8-D3]